MAKAEFGSARYQSKQLKASGLQKLKFYCQLCSKQCRDANGFKNHLSSRSHLGRVSNISDSGKAGSVLDQFSVDFEREFLRLLRINHGTKKISANKFYQEYILSDKDHVHMNATRWGSLTSFIKYLGRLGKVRVEIPDDEDEFNLFIRLVDTFSELLASEKSKPQNDEDRQRKFLEAQVKLGQELQAAEPQEVKTVPAGPVSLSLKSLVRKKPQAKSVFGDSDED